MHHLKISVLGDGAWGSALARHLDLGGHRVVLWSPFLEHVDEMRRTMANEKYLRGCTFSERVEFTSSLAESAAGADMLVLALPSQFARGMLERLGAELHGASPVVVNVAKGIEKKSLSRMSELCAELLGAEIRYGCLSGPSHAEEVLKSSPTAVVAAARDMETAKIVQDAFLGLNFRVYTHDDTVGVELGGALKNVYAIGAGIIDGLGLGDNPKAAMITRSVAEMSRLGRALGGKSETFSGLSGLGDLLVTCYSRHSRNRFVGERLGLGDTIAEALERLGAAVAEGVDTCESAMALAVKAGVDAPIIAQIHSVLREGKRPETCVKELMGRSAKPENY